MINYAVRYRNNGVPIIKNNEIEELAIALLLDFDKDILKYPKQVDIDKFIEFYLGLKIHYKDLTHNQSILGTIALSDGIYTVYDKEHDNILDIKINAGDILIDNHLLEDKNEGRLNYTLGHEAGHYITLKHLFEKKDINQLCIFENYKPSSVIQCRASHLCCEGGLRSYSKNDDEWKEYYADCMSAALIMPGSTMKMFASEFLSKFNLNYPLEIGLNGMINCLATDFLPSEVSKVFKVSKQAAKIRLIKLGIIIEKGKPQQLAL